MIQTVSPMVARGVERGEGCDTAIVVVPLARGRGRCERQTPQRDVKSRADVHSAAAPRLSQVLYLDSVTPLGRTFAALGLVVCLSLLTGACGSRTPPAGAPEQPQPQPAPPVQAPTVPPPARQAPSPPPPTPDSRPDADPFECAVITEPGSAVASVALADRVDASNAPHPTNESERLLFRQLYETLVRVDCNGRIRPGLAATWRLGADGRTWTVALREDAQFSDATPVTASDVRAGWSDDVTADELRPHVSRLVQSIEIVDERTLTIRLRRQQGDVPRVLAHTDLAVAKPVVGSRWPLGTRSDRMTVASEAPHGTGGSVITLTRDNLAPIRFLAAPGDPRDLLDQGVDLLLTRHPATLQYAATLPQFQSVPLAWQQTRVLVLPDRPRTATSLSDEARRVLANDAVRGEARGAAGPFWWQMLQPCAVPPAQPRTQTSLIPRVVYDASDGAARDLAERLVALNRASGSAASPMIEALLPDRPRRRYERAVGLTGEPLARALRVGNDAGYILSLDSRVLDSCGEIEVMIDRARWLEPDDIVPLVDTRLYAIMRRGRSGITAEWDGGLLIAGANGAR